jgi:hypothetical protein
LKGSREHTILQALRATAIVLAVGNIYLYTHITVYRYSYNILGIQDSDMGFNILYYANGVMGLVTMLYFGVVDLTSSVLMASS